jgi:predicted cupin superfamily sugar epimerase
MDDAEAIIAALGMIPHPEGGHYVEIYRQLPEGGGRGACTAIYYLLRRGERSHWHQVDAVEVWNHYDGGPLRLDISVDGVQVERMVLGPDLAAGQRPQAVVPARAWQAAEPVGDWVLVGCTVSPAFEFSGFTLAPPGWRPQSGG